MVLAPVPAQVVPLALVLVAQAVLALVRVNARHVPAVPVALPVPVVAAPLAPARIRA